MRKTMGGLQDLIEEAKLRTVWWILCIFAVTYFLTNTSKSMLMNIPIAVLIVSGLRLLLNDVEFRWKVRNSESRSYLSFLEKKQLSVNDSRLSTLPPPQKWKRNIDSPVVEAAIEDFIGKILQDFVVDLWYSDITPDREAPELIYGIIMDVLGEVSGRLKAVNLVDLLTKDVVDLIGDHLDMFRRNQAAIGVDVMKTLSSEQRDERLKHHLIASAELHPALVSAECEYKVLQRLMGGLLAAVLRRKEAQCPLVRSIARELLTCLVMQPIMNFASPLYINELIECIILAYHSDEFKDVATDQSPDMKVHNKVQSYENLQQKEYSGNQKNDSSFSQFDHKKDAVPGEPRSGAMHDESVHTQPADWAKKFEAATQRREEVLMPENLENMWGLGRNYKKKVQKKAVPGLPASKSTRSVHNTPPKKRLAIETPPALQVETSVGAEDEAPVPLSRAPQQDSWSTNFSIDPSSSSENHSQKVSMKGVSPVHGTDKTASAISDGNKNKIKRSSSTSDLKVQANLDDIRTTKGSASIINEYYTADSKKLNASNLKSSSDVVVRTEGLHVPKLRSRVIGAYFEKMGSNSFAVYSIAVTDAANNTWFVKRRYSNFERLHRHLKAIPNYTLHLPPKRIFSSSTEDAFVHQRCIQLDKYLQDLLSIANVAEQHEVWDFLSDSSKNYSFGKSASAMRTLAVNVDDAMDDIVRQFKGVSGGLMQAVVGPSSSSYAPDSSITSRNYSWHGDDINKLVTRQSTSESMNSYSTEEGDRDTNRLEEVASAAQADRWRSDDELESDSVALRHGENVDLDTEESHNLRTKSESSSRYPDSSLPITSVSQEDLAGVPPEWTPPNLSVPVLNLVDNIFQLKRRGWLRRQVFWISKQILQLVMEDAIDDWLVRQIQWLRREDVIAQGIRWVKDILWPGGTFFLRLRIQDQLDAFQGNERSQRTTKKGTQSGSFEKQLEAARQASDVKKMIFDGAPTTLVSLIGHKQYRRCARDIYYFLQSAVCLKQLGYGILELVMISIFPELRDLVTDIHEKAHVQPEM